ncbi:hypothetical protein BH11ACT8_BH11ACT8_16200 [soil metagenome]
MLTFEDAGGPGAIVPGTRNLGQAASGVTVTTSAGGRVLAAAGPEGMAVRFPAATGVEEGATPAAAIVVTPQGRTDELEPGTNDFSFGADVALDKTSEGPADNGDNLMQRGLFLDNAQYKLQLDHRRPSCRIAAGGRSAFVTADVEVVPESWYRLRCVREGAELRLLMSMWTGDSWGLDAQWSVRSRVRSITFEPPAGSTLAPLSVGAKVDSNARIPLAAGDPFNGMVDNVFVDVAGTVGIGGAP